MTKSRPFGEMSPEEFQESYVRAVNQGKFYVGGCGLTEDDLWWNIKDHEKWAKRHAVELPDYDSVSCDQADWV